MGNLANSNCHKACNLTKNGLSLTGQRKQLSHNRQCDREPVAYILPGYTTRCRHIQIRQDVDTCRLDRYRNLKQKSLSNMEMVTARASDGQLVHGPHWVDIFLLFSAWVINLICRGHSLADGRSLKQVITRVRRRILTAVCEDRNEMENPDWCQMRNTDKYMNMRMLIDTRWLIPADIFVYSLSMVPVAVFILSSPWCLVIRSVALLFFFLWHSVKMFFCRSHSLFATLFFASTFCNMKYPQNVITDRRVFWNSKRFLS